LFQQRRHAMLDKAHEGLDRHQAGVTRARAIVALGFKVLQEVHHQFGVDLLKT
jgi:hypothetical protein